MNLSLVAFLSVAGAVLGVAGIVAAAVAVIRSQLTRTTIELYKADNEALRHRINTLEEEKAEQQKQTAELVAQVTTLRDANRVLADQVTGASAIAQLEAKQLVWHRETVDLLRLLGVELKKREADHSRPVVERNGDE